MKIVENKLKIAIVDTDKIFLNGLSIILKKSIKNINIVFEASDINELIKRTPNFHCDILLIDYRIYIIIKETLINLLDKLHDTKIILTGYQFEEKFIKNSYNEGINGIILKENCYNDLIKSITEVSMGGYYYCKELIDMIFKVKKNENKKSENLSERETEILILFAYGNSIQEIANKLFISYRTVEKHKKNIKIKTGIKNDASFTLYALKNDLLKIQVK
jgi:DNA-binding NarL/FixJ family response regulator